VKNARSTVATATELADHIRLFMTYCGETRARLRRGRAQGKRRSRSRTILETLGGKRAVVLAPIFFDAEHRDVVLEQLVKAGFFRVWINGEVRDLNDRRHEDFTSFELVITRLRIDAERRTQITRAIEQAFELSKGT
jgi:excinuclease UvrABC ATPase subunit